MGSRAVRRNDSPVALLLRLLPGKIYVFDRAYNDLDFWEKIIKSKTETAKQYRLVDGEFLRTFQPTKFGIQRIKEEHGYRQQVM